MGNDLSLNHLSFQIVENYSFKNFDMVYYPFPLQEIVDDWTKKGNNVMDLIEPVDGFHPR